MLRQFQYFFHFYPLCFSSLFFSTACTKTEVVFFYLSFVSVIYFWTFSVCSLFSKKLGRKKNFNLWYLHVHFWKQIFLFCSFFLLNTTCKILRKFLFNLVVCVRGEQKRNYKTKLNFSFENWFAYIPTFFHCTICKFWFQNLFLYFLNHIFFISRIQFSTVYLRNIPILLKQHLFYKISFILHLLLLSLDCLSRTFCKKQHFKE